MAGTLLDGTVRSYPLGAITEPEFRRRRRVGLAFSGSVSALIYAALLFGTWRSGYLSAAHWTTELPLLGVSAAILAFFALLPPRGRALATSLAIGPDGIWFSGPKLPKRSLRLEQPGAWIVLRDRGASGVVAPTGDRLPSGRPRYYIGVGLGWGSPVTSVAYDAVVAELGRRGIPRVLPNPAQPRPTSGLVAYQVPLAAVPAPAA